VKLTVINKFDSMQHILSDPIVVSSNVSQQTSLNPPTSQPKNGNDYPFLIILVILACAWVASFSSDYLIKIKYLSLSESKNHAM